LEIHPSNKGEFNKLNQFILQNLAIDRIAGSITENTRFLADTLHIQFIISKDRKMSNLLMTGGLSNTLNEEFQRVLISSSCNWTPGEYIGGYLVGWFKKHLVLILGRRGRYMSLKVDWLKVSNDATAHGSSF
jgi:hypothetical protein